MLEAYSKPTPPTVHHWQRAPERDAAPQQTQQKHSAIPWQSTTHHKACYMTGILVVTEGTVCTAQMDG